LAVFLRVNIGGELVEQPLDIITTTAQWMPQLCSIAVMYYRVWYALRSICAMEFMAEII